MAVTTHLFSTMTGSRVDRKEGVIYGVAVITEGKTKNGSVADHTTLEQVSSVGNAAPSGVKVKLRHKMKDEFQSILESCVGVVKNFSVSKDKVIANLHVLESLDEKLKAKLFEMAEVMPEEFGLSVDIAGQPEKNFVRCEELHSVDLTEAPAANPNGLFEESKRMSKIKYKQGEEGEHHESCDCKECVMESRSKKMEADIAALTNLVKSTLEAKATSTAGTATSDVFTVKKDGKDIEVTAQQLFEHVESTRAAAERAALEATNASRREILEKMKGEGRVAVNPKTKIAYKLEELEKLPIETLEFAAANAPRIPLEAVNIFKGDGKGATHVDPNLKGSDKVVAQLEAQGFTSVEAMRRMAK